MAGGGSGVGDPRGSARARCPGLGPGLGPGVRPALYYSIFPCPGLRPARDEREFSRARACCANSAGARLARQTCAKRAAHVVIAARCCIKPNPQNFGTLRGHTPALFSPGKGCDRDRPRSRRERGHIATHHSCRSEPACTLRRPSPGASAAGCGREASR